MTDSLSHATSGEGRHGETADDGTEAVAGTETLVIQGSVRDSFGVALPRAVVTLTAATGGRSLAKTRSAADGTFRVTAPGHGDYLLAAFSPQLGRQSVTVRLAGRSVRVDFRIDVPDSVVP